MTQHFVIPGRLAGLNEYTRQCRSNPYAGNAAKKTEQQRIMIALRTARVQPARGPVILSYRWIEPNRKRDLDNIVFCQKYVQDALVWSGILEGDGWKHVIGMAHTFAVDKHNPRVEVEIAEVES